MTQHHILHLKDGNRAVFDTLTRPEIDTDECIRLTEPASNDVVDAFVNAHKALFLKPKHTVTSKDGKVELYSINDTVDVKTIGYAKPDAPERAAFVEKARMVISADIKADELTLGTDAIHELGVLFRSDDGKPWSIATTRSIPAIDYIKDLLKHPKVDGLESLLGMQTYEQNGETTKVLIRYYNFKAPTGVLVVPMFMRYHNGQVQTLYTPEDFFRDEFVTEEKLKELFEPQLGKLTKQKLLTLADLDECKPLVEGKQHFVIYKTKQTAYNNQNISGIFLQTDENNVPVIQRDDSTALDKILNWVNSQSTPLSPQIISPPTYTANVEVWTKKNLSFVQKVEQTAQGVKVEFHDNSYLLDTGKKLSLHGDTKEEYLRAMLQHAKDNWGGNIKIDSANETDGTLLRKLAAEMRVTVIEPAPLRPTRAAASTPAATPLAA